MNAGIIGAQNQGQTDPRITRLHQLLAEISKRQDYTLTWIYGHSPIFDSINVYLDNSELASKTYAEQLTYVNNILLTNNTEAREILKAGLNDEEWLENLNCHSYAAADIDMYAEDHGYFAKPADIHTQKVLQYAARSEKFFDSAHEQQKARNVKALKQSSGGQDKFDEAKLFLYDHIPYVSEGYEENFLLQETLKHNEKILSLSGYTRLCDINLGALKKFIQKTMKDNDFNITITLTLPADLNERQIRAVATVLKNCRGKVEIDWSNQKMKWSEKEVVSNVKKWMLLSDLEAAYHRNEIRYIQNEIQKLGRAPAHKEPSDTLEIEPSRISPKKQEILPDSADIKNQKEDWQNKLQLHQIELHFMKARKKYRLAGSAQRTKVKQVMEELELKLKGIHAENRPIEKIALLATFSEDVRDFYVGLESGSLLKRKLTVIKDRLMERWDAGSDSIKEIITAIDLVIQHDILTYENKGRANDIYALNNNKGLGYHVEVISTLLDKKQLYQELAEMNDWWRTYRTSIEHSVKDCGRAAAAIAYMYGEYFSVRFGSDFNYGMYYNYYTNPNNAEEARGLFQAFSICLHDKEFRKKYNHDTNPVCKKKWKDVFVHEFLRDADRISQLPEGSVEYHKYEEPSRIYNSDPHFNEVLVSLGLYDLIDNTCEAGLETHDWVDWRIDAEQKYVEYLLRQFDLEPEDKNVGIISRITQWFSPKKESTSVLDQIIQKIREKVGEAAYNTKYQETLHASGNDSNSDAVRLVESCKEKIIDSACQTYFEKLLKVKFDRDVLILEHTNFSEIPEEFSLGYVFCKNEDKIELFYYNKENGGVPVKLELKQNEIAPTNQNNFDDLLREIFQKSPKQLSDNDFEAITLFTGYLPSKAGYSVSRELMRAKVSGILRCGMQMYMEKDFPSILQRGRVQLGYHANEVRDYLLCIDEIKTGKKIEDKLSAFSSENISSEKRKERREHFEEKKAAYTDGPEPDWLTIQTITDNHTYVSCFPKEQSWFPSVLTKISTWCSEQWQSISSLWNGGYEVARTSEVDEENNMGVAGSVDVNDSHVESGVSTGNQLSNLVMHPVINPMAQPDVNLLTEEKELEQSQQTIRVVRSADDIAGLLLSDGSDSGSEDNKKEFSCQSLDNVDVLVSTPVAIGCSYSNR